MCFQKPSKSHGSKIPPRGALERLRFQISNLEDTAYSSKKICLYLLNSTLKLCSTYLCLELVLEGSVLKTYFAREPWLQAFAWETHQSQPGFFWPGCGDPFPDPTSVSPSRGASSPVTAVLIFWKLLSPFLPPKIKWTHRAPKPLAQASEAPRTQLLTWPRAPRVGKEGRRGPMARGWCGQN